MTPRPIRRRSTRWLFVFALATLVLPLPAHAQFDGQYKNIYTGRTFNNPMSASLDTFIMHSMQRNMMYRSVLQKKGYSKSEIDQILRKSNVEILGYMGKKKPVTDAPAEKTPATKTATVKPVAKPVNAVPATRFKPTGSRLLLNQAADAFGNNDEEKKAFRTIFAEVAKAYEGEARRLGLANDIAGAMAFYSEVAYTLYKPDAKPTGDAGTKALVRQLQEVMDNDELRKASAAEKQKLYEYYLGLAAYLYALSEIAKQSNDEKAKEGAVKLGGEALRGLFKVDPARISLTENGLEIAPE